MYMCVVWVGGQGDHLMHSKQLKHLKPLNPDRRRQRGSESGIERDVMEGVGVWGGMVEPRESLFPSGR